MKMELKSVTVVSYNLTNNQIVTKLKKIGGEAVAYFFSSYNATICKVDLVNNIIYVHKNWNYSRTTKKWFNNFLSIVLDEKIKFEEQEKIKIKNNIFSFIMLDK